MRNKLFISVLSSLLVSIVAALYGLGLSYDGQLIPAESPDEFVRISADGWIENGAKIKLDTLASRGNRGVFIFDPWRPTGMPAAHLEIFVCGESRAEFQVEKVMEVPVSLSSICAPREISIEVKNPFTPSLEDPRQLGAKLTSFTVTSRLAVPLLELPFVLLVALGVWALTLSAALSTGSAVTAPIITGLISFAILLTQNPLLLKNAASLWLVCEGVMLGVIFSAKHLCSTWNSEAEREDRGFLMLALLITAVAAAFRFYGLDFGLPQNYHPDEVPKVNALMEMRAHGDLNPRYFLHPSLLLYSTYFLNQVFQGLGIVSGTWQETAYLAGRTVSALAGTLSILLLYYLGRLLLGTRAALFASFLLAVAPLHITVSRYLKEDALLTFIVLAALLAGVKAAYSNRPKLFLLALFLAGMSVSVKYSGVLVIPLVIAAPWLCSHSGAPSKNFIKALFFGAPLVLLGFFLCTPYSLIDNATFMRDVAYEQNHLLRGHTVGISAWSQLWMFHVTRSLIPGLGLIPILLASIGAGICLAGRRREGLLIIAGVLLFYLPAEWAKSKPEPQPERYVVPCLPFLVLLCAHTFKQLLASQSKVLPAAVILLTAALPVARSIGYTSELKADTRDKLADWMRKNIPVHAKIAIDWKNYAPAFTDNYFNVTYISPEEFLDKISVSKLRKSGFDYLLLSSLYYERYFRQPTAPAVARERIRDVFRRVPVVKEQAPRHGTYGFHSPTLTLFSLKESDFDSLNSEIELKEAGEAQRTSNDVKASFRWHKR